MLRKGPCLAGFSGAQSSPPGHAIYLIHLYTGRFRLGVPAVLMDDISDRLFYCPRDSFCRRSCRSLVLSFVFLRLGGMPLLLFFSSVALAVPPTGQTAPPGGSQRSFGPVEVHAGVDFNAYAYRMQNAWWGLAEAQAPEFDDDLQYLELWLHPRIHATYAPRPDTLLYAGLSAGITQDIGRNAFDYRDQGAARFENAYVGVALGAPDAWHFDLSSGRQTFSVGTGMLLHAGAINGNEWGSTASAKRLAWRQTAVARVGYSKVSSTFFWLDPHEVPSAESETRIAGAAVEWKDTDRGNAGLAYIHVPQSDYFYPGDLAPIAFIEGGREGLSAYHGWSELNGLLTSLPALSLRAEFAIEKGRIERIDGRRDDLSAFGGYIGAAYGFNQLPFAPKLTYGYAYFSGDDPSTSDYERFDPLYWGNGLDNWWFGANGAYGFINSNVRFHRLTLDAFASARDIFKFQYVRASAVELESPIQFGQAVRFGPDSLVPTVGVSQYHLSDEVMVQYVHVLTASVVVSGYITHSMPGSGLDGLIPGGGKSWTSVGIGISASL